MKHTYSTSARMFALTATLLSALIVSSPSHAQSTATTRGEATAATDIRDVGNPTINLPGANPYQRSDFHTNQAATAATVFVNPPSADTCAKAGSGGSLQVAGVGAAVSVGGEESAKCDVRADTINLKVTGASANVIKARHCMDKQMAEAYARAGEPCVDARPPAPVQQAAAAGEPTDPFVRRRQGLPPL